LNCGKDPPCLVRLANTRWLSWYGAVKTTLDQWDALKCHFEMRAGEKCYTARTLAAMYNDPVHRLYLTFLRPILRDMTVINTVFQASNGDITKIHIDLRTLILSIASRIMRPEAMKESRPTSILRKSELEMLNVALSQGEKLLPADRVYLGEAFQTLSTALALPQDIMLPVKQRCAEFLQVLVRELVNRLPNNVETVEKL